MLGLGRICAIGESTLILATPHVVSCTPESLLAEAALCRWPCEHGEVAEHETLPSEYPAQDQAGSGARVLCRRPRPTWGILAARLMVSERGAN